MKTPRHIAIENAAADALTQMQQAGKMFRDDPEWNAALKALEAAFKIKESLIKVCVLTIEHRHGRNVSVHDTEESANMGLHHYVEENWAQEMGNKSMPSDSDKMIETYFEFVEDEHAEIEECEVES